MNKDQFLKILVNPINLTTFQINEIKEVIDKYPYFQCVKSLYLKGLNEIQSYKYNHFLKLTAAYTADRGVLFDFITSPKFNQNEIALRVKENQDSLKEIEVEYQDLDKNSPIVDKLFEKNVQETQSIWEQNLFVQKTKQESENKVSTSRNETNIEEKKNKLEEIAPELNFSKKPTKKALNLGKPLHFNKNEKHTFQQWMNLAAVNEIARENEPKKEKQIQHPLDKQMEIIDRFIEENPKIKPIKDRSEKVIIPMPDTVLDENVMTETLARIYVEQKKYKKALQSYKILCLKYPEKKPLFANQIKALEELIENN